MNQSREQLQLLFRSGVDAITSVTARFADDDWERPACGSWTARQTALHTVGVIDWYHEWLNQAIEGEHSRPFPPEEMDQRTERDVERLADMSGPDAIQHFRTRALDYVERTTSHWDATYAYPFGIVTTGLHCGVAATEWHLHAWDIATSSTTDYAPPDPESLLIAAGSCVAAARGGLGGALLKRVVPLAAKRSPWKKLLQQSGRQLGDTQLPPGTDASRREPND